MATDLNKLSEKLKAQRPVGVTRDGKLTTDDPGNDGTNSSRQGTTLQPQRFYF